MALQVWLPLTKDLTQQGLSGVEATNNGTVVNNDGKLGKCYQFDGNDYITLPIKFLGPNYSYSAWVYTTSASATQTLSCCRAAVGSGFSLFLIGGKIRIDPGGNNVQWTTNYTYPINTWFHIVVTCNNGEIKYYIDGEYKQEYSTTLNESQWGTLFSIGASQANGSNYGNYLTGRLNDIRIYDHCLSIKEIKELSKGLMLHYKIDDLAEEYNNIVFDSSGYKNNGTLISTPILSTDSAKYSASTFFDGMDDGILIEDLQLSNIINSEVTYSFWIKPDDEAGKRSVYFGSYSGTSWSIEKTAGNILRLYWNGSPDETTSGVTIADDIWQHICITKKGTNDIKVYINGIQKWASTAVHNALTFPTTYRIGRDTRSGDNTPYKGLMSDFRIYATALSVEDVAELYHTAASIDKQGNLFCGEVVE